MKFFKKTNTLGKYNGWHKASEELPFLHEKCVVLYKLKKLDHVGYFPATSVVVFFASDVNKEREWIPYPNGPVIDYWIPLKELPEDYREFANFNFENIAVPLKSNNVL